MDKKRKSSHHKDSGKSKKSKSDNESFLKELKGLQDLYTDKDDHYRNVKITRGPLVLDW